MSTEFKIHQIVKILVGPVKGKNGWITKIYKNGDYKVWYSRKWEKRYTKNEIEIKGK